GCDASPGSCRNRSPGVGDGLPRAHLSAPGYGCGSAAAGNGRRGLTRPLPVANLVTSEGIVLLRLTESGILFRRLRWNRLVRRIHRLLSKPAEEPVRVPRQ